MYAEKGSYQPGGSEGASSGRGDHGGGREVQRTTAAPAAAYLSGHAAVDDAAGETEHCRMEQRRAVAKAWGCRVRADFLAQSEGPSPTWESADQARGRAQPAEARRGSAILGLGSMAAVIGQETVAKRCVGTGGLCEMVRGGKEGTSWRRRWRNLNSFRIEVCLCRIHQPF